MVKHLRGQWSGQLGFILAASGAAIGLGNIWKFPYMAGENGGSAFVVVYLACVVLVGLPVMVAEIMLGRRAKRNPVDGLAMCAKESSSSEQWRWLGWWGLLGLLLVLSFYSVVAGWSIYYLYLALSGDFTGLTAHAVATTWSGFLASPGRLLLFHVIFMALTMWVVAKGVSRGLERASKIMTPLLFLILIVLVGYAALSTGPYFGKALHFLFDFHFDQVTPTVVIDAMGHAFFTLAIGVGAMMIYGSYLPNKISIGTSVAITAGLDVLVALLSGLAIFPIVFAYHLSPGSGPGLMFVTLPIAFAKMSAGHWVGTLFFVLILFAAWTSSINMAEPLVATLHEKTGLSRGWSCVVIGLVAGLLGLLSILSFNVWAHAKLFGLLTPFDVITDAVTNVIQPIGGIFYALLAGWFIARQVSLEELAFRCRHLYRLWRFLCRWVSPIAIAVVFVTAILGVSS